LLDPQLDPVKKEKEVNLMDLQPDPLEHPSTLPELAAEAGEAQEDTETSSESGCTAQPAAPQVPPVEPLLPPLPPRLLRWWARPATLLPLSMRSKADAALSPAARWQRPIP